MFILTVEVTKLSAWKLHQIYWYPYCLKLRANNILPWCDGHCGHRHPFPLNNEAAMSADGCTIEAELPGCVWITLHGLQRRLLNTTHTHTPHTPPHTHPHPHTHTHFQSSMPASMYVSLHQAKISCLLGLHSLDTSTVKTLQVREGQLRLHAGHKIYLGFQVV